MGLLRFNGIKLEYHLHGCVDNSPIVLIHGLGSSADEWMYQTTALKTDHYVIAPTLRGHGGSDKPAGVHSIREHANDVFLLLDYLGIKKFHLLGFSLGGAIAYQMAVDRPQSISKLVVVNSIASFELDHWRKYFAVFMRVGMTKLFGMQRMARFAAKRMFPDPGQGDLRRQMISRHRHNDRDSYLASLNALVGWSVRDQLSSLHHSVLIIASEHDFIALDDKRIDQELLANARVAFIRDSHHGPQFDQIDVFNDIVLEFLQD